MLSVAALTANVKAKNGRLALTANVKAKKEIKGCLKKKENPVM